MYVRTIVVMMTRVLHEHYSVIKICTFFNLYYKLYYNYILYYHIIIIIPTMNKRTHSVYINMIDVGILLNNLYGLQTSNHEFFDSITINSFVFNYCVLLYYKFYCVILFSDITFVFNIIVLSIMFYFL